MIDVLSQPKLGHKMEGLPVATAVVETPASSEVDASLEDEVEASEVVEVCMSVTEVGSREG